MLNLVVLTILNQFWFYQICMIAVAKIKGNGAYYDNFKKIQKSPEGSNEADPE